MFVDIFFCITFALFLKLKLLFYYLIYKKMKKLVLSIAVIASMSLFACGGSSDKQAEAVDTVAAEEVVAAEEEVVEAVDTLANDTVVVAEGEAVVAE